MWNDRENPITTPKMENIKKFFLKKCSSRNTLAFNVEIWLLFHNMTLNKIMIINRITSNMANISNNNSNETIVSLISICLK